MKIVIASDSFKGSKSSLAVAARVEAGIRKVYPDAEILPVAIADGGEGTVDAMIAGAGGRRVTTRVTGPLGEETDSFYGMLDTGEAVIEMAAASGLPMVPADRKDPRITTTYGTGQLLRAALDAGARKIYIGIGGSATNDGGIGLAQALGASFRDAAGHELGYGGAELARLAHIDLAGLDPRLMDTEIVVSCDVNNTLCGERGASAIFGPQKGATPEMVRMLDDALAHYAEVVRTQLGIDHADTPGAGAAGGLGYALLVFAQAQLRPGIEIVLDVAGFDAKAADADLVITGEGRIDAQSVMGKVPVGVGMRAKKWGKPVLAIVGDIGPGADAVYAHGVDAIMSTVNRAMPLDEALARSGELLEDAAERVMRMVRLGTGIGSQEGR